MIHYYKIVNFINKYTRNADYKGLNMENYVSNSQFSDDVENFCVLKSLEDLEHDDLVKLTEEEYNNLVKILNPPRPINLTLEEQLLKIQQDNITLMDAMASMYEEILNLKEPVNV